MKFVRTMDLDPVPHPLTKLSGSANGLGPYCLHIRLPKYITRRDNGRQIAVNEEKEKRHAPKVWLHGYLLNVRLVNAVVHSTCSAHLPVNCGSLLTQIRLLISGHTDHAS